MWEANVCNSVQNPFQQATTNTLQSTMPELDSPSGLGYAVQEKSQETYDRGSRLGGGGVRRGRVEVGGCGGKKCLTISFSLRRQECVPELKEGSGETCQETCCMHQYSRKIAVWRQKSHLRSNSFHDRSVIKTLDANGTWHVKAQATEQKDLGSKPNTIVRFLLGNSLKLVLHLSFLI